MKQELGIDVELIKGDAGVFDVVAAGETVFSKHAEGRFPEDDEIVAALRERS